MLAVFYGLLVLFVFSMGYAVCYARLSPQLESAENQIIRLQSIADEQLMRQFPAARTPAKQDSTR